MITDTSSATHVQIDIDEDQDDVVATEAVVDEDGKAPVVSSSEDEDVIDEDADLDPSDRLPKRAVQNSDGSVTLPLRFPRTLKTKKGGRVRERQFTDLVFHRLTGADQRAIAAASAESQDVTAFARSTRLNQAVMNALFDKMDIADVADGGRVLNNFFASGTRTRTGKPGSA
ncbi:hypothetical protein DYI37_11395 [Fulvimarina endophytica]|uniref:Uncharacterized protein n=1 Tax=Fulvimarina endophytica TaxID=2293836 RepID=A0A371X307_9HYPH|nr:hypothetical protein [Fulvimarina endophytica]RFC63603.1 hypothetical protein DYI37_11395 [Fulvimarina endophytica]